MTISIKCILPVYKFRNYKPHGSTKWPKYNSTNSTNLNNNTNILIVALCIDSCKWTEFLLVKADPGCNMFENPSCKLQLNMNK